MNIEFFSGYWAALEPGNPHGMPEGEWHDRSCNAKNHVSRGHLMPLFFIIAASDDKDMIFNFQKFQ